MTRNMWLSKDDMIKDLAECTGTWVNDLDDDYIVRGSRPPPPVKRSEVDDVELKLRFGAYGDQASNIEENRAPDLRGITQMLRLVETFDNPQDKYLPRRESDAFLKSNHTAKQIVISRPQSKLNPNVEPFVPKTAQINANVEPFVPKTAQITNQMPDVINITNEITKNIENETVDTKSSLNSEKNTYTNNNKNAEELEKEKMVALLKSKISTASKDESIEKKRERNVAMQALLRLNSGTPKVALNGTPKSESSPKHLLPGSKPSESLNKDPKPIVLFTPDYFAGPSYSPTVLNVEDSEHNIPEPKPLLDTSLNKANIAEVADPEIKQSIEKVTRWLDSPEKKSKPRALVAHIGPITFKKKEPVSSSSSSTVSMRTEPVTAIPAYKPSKYAEELAKDFEARVKAREEEEKRKQPPIDIWTKLETELKAKDEIIKNRWKEQSLNTSGEDTGTSSPKTGKSSKSNSPSSSRR